MSDFLCSHYCILNRKEAPSFTVFSICVKDELGNRNAIVLQRNQMKIVFKPTEFQLLLEMFRSDRKGMVCPKIELSGLIIEEDQPPQNLLLQEKHLESRKMLIFGECDKQFLIDNAASIMAFIPTTICDCWYVITPPYVNNHVG